MLVLEQHWRLAAACRSAEPDIFFPLSSSGRSLDQIAQAKEICAGCRVRTECLAFALRTNQAHGVWGGLSEEERLSLARDALRVSANAKSHTAVPHQRVPLP
jgi:WhiB family redox-sensing transcriptional regulator